MAEKIPDLAPSSDKAIPDPSAFTKYQIIHLFISGAGVIVAAMALFYVVQQVEKLGLQIERQTEVNNMQKRALEAQNGILAAQKLSFDAQAWQTINTQQLAVTRTMVEYPELVPYFYDGMAINRNDKNFNRAMAAADIILDFIDGFDNKYIRSLDGMEEKGQYWVLWENYFVDSFARSPALCLRYAQLKDWYVNWVGKFAETGCKRRTAGTSASPAKPKGPA